MSSNVGSHNIYEDGDQKNVPRSQQQGAERYQEGAKGSHKTDDSKDQRSIANRLGDEAKHRHHDAEEKDVGEEAKLSQQDPTKPAKLHGNEPSKGAKIDAQIAAEEEEMLKKKDGKN